MEKPGPRGPLSNGRNRTLEQDARRKLQAFLRRPEGTAAVAALVCGVVVHLFGLVNILHNSDDIDQQPGGYGTGVTSGRWLLSLLGDLVDKLRGNYNLPVVNGLLFLLLLAMAAGLMVGVFRIHSRGMAAWMGMALVVFPSVQSILTFRYTAVYYGLAVVLAVLAAWVLERHRLGWLVSAVLVGLSLGLYQAFIPITIGVFVLRLLQLTLSGQTRAGEIIRRGLICCGVLALGLALYFVGLKLTLALYGTQLSDYKGVDHMGVHSLGELAGLVKMAYYVFLTMPLRNHWGLAGSPVLKGIYVLLGCLSVGMVARLLAGRDWASRLVAAALCLVFPLAAGFVIIMCPEGDLYTLMVYGYVMVPCAPVVLLSCFPEEGRGKKGLTRAVAWCLALVVFCYGYQTNVNDTAMYYFTRQVENYVSSLLTQVRMTEGFDTQKKWAFLGRISDPLLGSYWQYELEFGGGELPQVMLDRPAWSSWLRSYCGYMPPMASDAEAATLADSPEVRQMPCWPDSGSIRVIGDTVVIKLSETAPS